MVWCLIIQILVPRVIKELAGIEELPKEEVYSKVNKDVVKFISENDGMIGVVGLNWLYQPSPDMKDLKKISAY
jgi:phosphate transport system substrate-binding protein